MLWDPQRAGPRGYEWWYLDVEAGDLTVIAIVFDGFPFALERARAGALVLDVYRAGRRVLSVMAVDREAQVSRGRVGVAGAALDMGAGRLHLQVEAWAPLPGAVVSGTVSVEGNDVSTRLLPGDHAWSPLVIRG